MAFLFFFQQNKTAQKINVWVWKAFLGVKIGNFCKDEEAETRTNSYQFCSNSETAENFFSP